MFIDPIWWLFVAWIPIYLIKGWTVNKTRKFVITLGAAIMIPALLAMSVASTPILAVLIMAVILFGFQTSIGNVQTLPSDLYSKKVVGSLAGYAGTAGGGPRVVCAAYYGSRKI